MSGWLVVLNGASSAGKTTTAKAMCELVGRNCIVTGLDEFLERAKPFGDEPKNPFESVRRSVLIARFQMMDGRWKLFQQMHREAAALVEQGNNVIVETAFMEARLLTDAAQCFAPVGGYLIGVKPPLEISERWEAARTDRPRGQARRHYEQVHAHGLYDLVIDTSTQTPAQCAQAILERMKTPPSAFAALARRVSKAH